MNVVRHKRGKEHATPDSMHQEPGSMDRPHGMASQRVPDTWVDFPHFIVFPFHSLELWFPRLAA